MHVHTSKFYFGQTVYLRTDIEQLPRLVTVISFRGSSGHVVYTLTGGTQDSDHYEFEISSTADEAMRLGLEKTATP